MKISIDNYEAWLLDFLEGRLDAAQAALLRRFLDEHPELDVGGETELLSLPDEQAEPTRFFDNLKKTAGSIVPTAGYNASNFEEAFAAFHEGDLGEQEMEGLQRFIAENPSLAGELDLFGRLRVEPDTSVIFEQKSLLRRHRTIPMVFRWGVPAAAAAAIALMVMINPAGNGPANVDSSIGGTISQQPVAPEKHDQVVPSPAIAGNNMTPATEIQEKKHAGRNTGNRQKIRHRLIPVTPLQAIAVNNITGPVADMREITEGPRYYTSLYADICLRDRIRFQQEIDEQGGQTIYNDARQTAEKNRFDLWTLARLSVKGFNLLTNSDIEFSRASDENGNVTDFAIGGEAVRIAHSSK